MRGVKTISLAVLMAATVGAACAGEDGMMALRGNPPGGVRLVNAVFGLGQGGVGEEGTQTPAVLAASRVEEPEGSVRGRPGQFIRWRNNCIRTPGIVGAGADSEGGFSSGFGFTPRFVVRGGEGQDSFIMTLWKALASD